MFSAFSLEALGEPVEASFLIIRSLMEDMWNNGKYPVEALSVDSQLTEIVLIYANVVRCSKTL